MEILVMAVSHLFASFVNSLVNGKNVNKIQTTFLGLYGGYGGIGYGHSLAHGGYYGSTIVH